MTTRILFAGMNGAGKSTLACSVYASLQSWGYDVGLHEIDVWSDTHAPILGRKAWSERNKRGNDVRNYLADEFAAATRRFAADERHELLLGDLHGRWQMPDAEHWTDLAADHAVLVVRNPTPEDDRIACPQRPEEWERFLDAHGIPVAFSVWSLRPDQTRPVGSVSVTGLDRELHRIDPDVWQVACQIVDLMPE